MAVKQQLFTELAKIAQAIASPQRLELLDYVAQAERSVEALSQLMNLSMANTSKHLQVLKQCALVKVRVKGNQRLYYVACDEVVELINCLRKTAESQLQEVNHLIDTYISRDETLAPVTSEALFQLIEQGDVLVLDIRPEEEYAQGHIAQAINVPPENMQKILAQLEEPEKTIVTYCRGPYCLFAHDAVQFLQQKGLNARRLTEGFPEWKAAGFPVNVN
ncbi:MAG: metalloregulator ArsR/SmtB family transcription factor [Thiomicrorhabdus sp.]|nr:metalloregulator ArsR/SmtB family transcription factor [Thiomicrorhabdus sp.]